jgi:hypothetical protein
MTEKIILKETITKGKPEVENKPKKKYYKPKKKREIIEVDIKDLDLNHDYIQNGIIKKPEQVGSYKVGKSFHIFFEEKPNPIHIFFTKLFLGWKWQDQKIKK